MRKILLFASVLAFFVSCSSKPNFELEVNILNNNSLMDKKIVLVQNKNGAVVYSDTLKIRKNNFILKLPYNDDAILNISIPESNIKNVMMAAEEGKIELNIDGDKTQIGGSLLNDRLQAFYNGADSVSNLFRQLEIDYAAKPFEGKLTAKEMEEIKMKDIEYREKRSQLLKENTDRIIAFIRENIDNPIGEYYFMTNYITFPIDRKLELNSFATEKLKKEFGLQ